MTCPACTGALAEDNVELACAGCGRRFPVVAGIPDLRLSYPDPYLSWEDDLERARALELLFDELDFPALLREHWRQSGKPPEIAERFIAGGLAERARSEAYLAAIEHERGAPLGRGDHFLEIGCGLAGVAEAVAARTSHAVASDVSMRWLVLAKKRLAEAEVKGIELVCCAAEHPPFATRTFDLVAASDVIEHVADQPDFLAAASEVLRPGGMLFLATPNRLSLSLEPHVRLWGVGWLPRRVARAYVRAVRHAPYDHVRLLSAPGLRRLVRGAGFEVTIVPPEIPAATQDLYSGVELSLVRVYNRMRGIALVRRALLAIGPFFHVFARKPA